MRKIRKEKERAEITLSVADDSNFLSTYCPIGNPVISQEVADYLENAAKEFPPDRSLKLTVCGDCIDGSERVIYDKAIRNYYALKKTEAERDAKRKRYFALTFFLIGVVALSVMIFFSNHGMKDIWTECVDIFAWVFLWEAVDQFFIERKILLTSRLRFLRFTQMEIVFRKRDGTLF